MSESIIAPIEIEISGRKLRLRYSKNRVSYRLPEQRGKNSFARLVDNLWACAVNCPFATPEDLADVVTEGDADRIVDALNRCFDAGTRPDDKSEPQ
jgi:hypothetical protein